MILEKLLEDILNDLHREESKLDSKTMNLLPLKMYHVNHEELKDNYNGF